MNRAQELALAVLVDSGMVAQDENGYYFVTSKEIAINSNSKEAELIVPDWLMSMATKRMTVDGNYITKTPQQRVMAAYKIAKDIAYDDRNWDKHQFNVWRRAADKLIDAFDGDDKKASYWLQEFSRDMKGRELSWNLATAARVAWDTKGER